MVNILYETYRKKMSYLINPDAFNKLNEMVFMDRRTTLHHQHQESIDIVTDLVSDDSGRPAGVLRTCPT